MTPRWRWPSYWDRDTLRSYSKRPGSRALVGTLAGSAAGFALPFAVASHFGVGRLTDAYVYALSIATFGLTLSISVLEPNTLPLAQAAVEGGSLALRSFARRTSLRAATAVGALAVPVGVAGAAVVAGRHNWPFPERHLAVGLIAIFLALVTATGASSVLASCLYALDCFLLPTVTQGLRAAVPLAALTVLGHGRYAAELLAVTVICGELLRIVILAIQLLRLSAGLKPSARTGHKLLGLWRAAVPAAFGVVVLAANPIIDRAVASRFGPGSVTVLDLGEKLFWVPITIIQASLVLVAGARWVRLNRNRSSALRHDFYRSIKRALALATCLSLLMAMVLILVPILFDARLGGVSVKRITVVCLCFVVGLPGASIWMMCARMLTITQETRILPIVAFGAMVLNLTGDLVGAAVWGLSGIALASSLAATLTGAVGLVACRVLLRAESGGPMWLRPHAARADGS